MVKMKEHNQSLSGRRRTANEKTSRLLPWLTAGLITVIGFIHLKYFPPDLSNVDNYFIGLILVVSVGFLVPGSFAFLGTLIITRQPGNRVGWLMLIIAIVAAIPLDGIQQSFFPSPPEVVSPGLWVLLWLQDWLWLLTFLSILLILHNFPSGSPPSPRWGWFNKLALGMLMFWATCTMFWEEIGIEGYISWWVENPIGFIPEIISNILEVLNIIGLFILAGGSIASLFVRYRRAGSIERQQIKWLLFASALFIVAFGQYLYSYIKSPPGATLSILIIMISFFMVPVTIAIAILRHRLYDIDVIIRKTLQYTLLTGTLALTYFGAAVVLQRILSPITGESNSPLVIVISTLAIAALFSPLRTRIQGFIDRRFYRQKYDAEQTLANFATTARDEVDVDRLIAALTGVVEDTMQPEQLGIWMKRQRTR